ncbi:hypothetical protein CMV_005384 [Castanea mollissima]|uniref:F-box/kelch-repeat protein n=1 Tax=Castanea mollissima TaxID=60419 RepID=A0A8J4VSF2_9ROSI|nr:hypothetical protein CMV_005384 [Castanea mollissima]
MENTFEICLCGKAVDNFCNCDDDIKFYVIKVPYVHQECSSSSSSSWTMRKKKEEENVEHLIPVSVQKAQTCNHFAVLDGKLYFVTNDLSSDAPVRTSENLLCHEVWTLDLARAEEGWSCAPRLKTGRCNPHTIVLGGKLYVLGGFDLKKNMRNRFPWMEVFDPVKRKWKPLPNLGFSIRSDLVFTASLEDEDNQKILVATISPGGEIAQIYGYDVAACLWTKLLADCKMGFHFGVPRPVSSIEMDYSDFGSFVTAGSTLYWASNRDEDDYICHINAFDLVNQKSYEECLHTGSIFGRQELLNSVRPDLLNLPDGNFCPILQSKRIKKMKKSRKYLYAHYIYCVVLKMDKEEEEEEEEEVEEEEEYDDVYKHGLRVSILSVHKYSVDEWIPLLENDFVVNLVDLGFGNGGRWAVEVAVLRQLAPDVSFRSLVMLGSACVEGLSVASFENDDAEHLLFFCTKQGKVIHPNNSVLAVSPSWCCLLHLVERDLNHAKKQNLSPLVA